MIFVEEFGVTKKGERVMLFRLSGVNAAVELISYGCAIRAVQIPGGEGLRRVLRLSNPENGLGLTMLSTLPTIHVYTGDGLPEPRSSVALEAQFIPNGINSEVFPSPILRKGDVWKHRTVYKFG